MNNDDQLQVLGLALKLQSEAICEFLTFLDVFFSGEWEREMLETIAKERGVFFDNSVSDYNLFSGILSSMKIDLLNVAGQISDKIQIEDE